MAVHSLILTVSLLLLTAAGTASGQCSSSPVPKEVNETSPVGTVIEVLDSSYNQVATPTIDAVYACYFELVNSTLRLKRQFNLENFTSCVDDSTVTPLSPQSIQIGCSGGGVTATFLVRLVDVNEFPPTFEPNVFRVNVSEAIALGTSIIQLNSYVKDKDFSNVRTFNILIVSGSNNDFGMNSGITSGIVTVQRALDYDAGPRQYVMNISAADLAYESTSLPVPLTGYATLIVDVQDADDLSPVFSESSYSLYFMENDTSYLNRSLETSPVLLARDGDIGINQTINYAIESASWSGVTGSKLDNVTFLSINASTGLFTLMSLIDRESLPSSTLLVQVRAYQTDKPTSRISVTLCLVTVGDKNDNAPVMSSAVYNVSVAENSLINTYVTAVKASDADLGENATFIFLLNDTTGAFQIDANSGLVTVANPALLDREARSSFTILVWARESLTPEKFASPASQLTVNLIDVNDNAPAFNASSYAFVVSEDAPVGTPIGAVFATDGDADVASGNGRIGRYDIVWSGSGVSALVALNPTTGVLTTKASLTGASAKLVLQVSAEDAASPVSARLRSTVVVEITVSAVPTSSSTLDSVSSSIGSSPPVTSTVSTTPTEFSTTATESSTLMPTTPADTTTTTAVASSSTSTVTTAVSTTLSSETTSSSSVDSVWNSTTGVTGVWLVNGSFALVEVLTTVTTVAGNQTTTTQTTLLPVNGSTTIPGPSSGTGEAGMSGAQIALIIICVLLLLLAIALTAALLWCWKTRQPKPLSAINLAYGNGAFAGNGDAAYKNPQRQDEPAEAEGQTATAAAVAAGDSAGAATEATVEQPNGAAGSPTAGQPNPMGSADGHSPSGLTLSRIMFEPAPYQSLAFSVIVPELSSGEEAADSENNGLPILRTAV